LGFEPKLGVLSLPFTSEFIYGLAGTGDLAIMFLFKPGMLAVDLDVWFVERLICGYGFTLPLLLSK
jgi:hypothetical protein